MNGFTLWMLALQSRSQLTAFFRAVGFVYEGPLDDPARFVAWCVNRITAPEKVDILKKQFSLAVLKGVWGVLRNNIDLAQGRPLDKEARDIAARAWRQFYLLEKADTITDDKGLAKYFREMGYWQARAWKTDQLRFEEDHLSFDDEEQFRSYGVDDNVGDETPTDHSVHPFYPGPNDGLDGLPPTNRNPRPGQRSQKRRTRSQSGSIRSARSRSRSCPPTRGLLRFPELHEQRVHRAHCGLPKLANSVCSIIL